LRSLEHFKSGDIEDDAVGFRRKGNRHFVDIGRDRWARAQGGILETDAADAEDWVAEDGRVINEPGDDLGELRRILNPARRQLRAGDGVDRHADVIDPLLPLLRSDHDFAFRTVYAAARDRLRRRWRRRGRLGGRADRARRCHNAQGDQSAA